jgi:hypothetical protein
MITNNKKPVWMPKNISPPVQISANPVVPQARLSSSCLQDVSSSTNCKRAFFTSYQQQYLKKDTNVGDQKISRNLVPQKANQLIERCNREPRQIFTFINEIINDKRSESVGDLLEISKVFMQANSDFFTQAITTFMQRDALDEYCFENGGFKTGAKCAEYLRTLNKFGLFDYVFKGYKQKDPHLDILSVLEQAKINNVYELYVEMIFYKEQYSLYHYESLTQRMKDLNMLRVYDKQNQIRDFVLTIKGDLNKKAYYADKKQASQSVLDLNKLDALPDDTTKKSTVNRFAFGERSDEQEMHIAEVLSLDVQKHTQTKQELLQKMRVWELLECAKVNTHQVSCSEEKSTIFDYALGCVVINDVATVVKIYQGCQCFVKNHLDYFNTDAARIAMRNSLNKYCFLVQKDNSIVFFEDYLHELENCGLFGAMFGRYKQLDPNLHFIGYIKQSQLESVADIYAAMISQVIIYDLSGELNKQTADEIKHYMRYFNMYVTNDNAMVKKVTDLVNYNISLMLDKFKVAAIV